MLRDNTWLLPGKDEKNLASNQGSRIFSSSFKRSHEIDGVDIAPSPGTTVDVWLNPTADENNIFLNTQNVYDKTTNTLLESTGYLISIDRRTKQIKWRVSIPTYTGVSGDYSRSAPAIEGDRLYIASGLQAMQTSATQSNSNAVLYNLFTGKPIQLTHTPPSMICINKHTGKMIWKGDVAKKANYYDDEDNMSVVTASPVLFRMDQRRNHKQSNGCRHPTGYNPLIVAVGVSSVQSFTPAISSFSPATVFAPQPNTAYSAQQTESRFTTDVGRIVFFNADTGAKLASVSAGPPLYTEGNVLDNSLPVMSGGGYLVPGKSTFTIYRWLSVTDVSQLGLGVTASYAGNQEVTFVLTNHFGLGTKVVPPVLNGENIVDRHNTPVTLVGGQLIGENLEGVVITIKSVLPVGSKVFPYKGNDYPFGEGFVGARMLKYMKDGDTLDKADAYEMNYYGASVWSSTPVIASNPDGSSPLYSMTSTNTLYIVTGQCHKMPAEDAISARDGSLSYVTVSRIIRAAQDQYLANPTPQHLQDWKDTVAIYNIEIDKYNAIPKSPRRLRFCYCGIVSIDLEKALQGDSDPILTALQVGGYDCWNLGFDQFSLRSLNQAGTVPYNGSSSPFKNMTLYTDIEGYMGSPMGPDGDFSSGPSLINMEDGSVYIAAANKQGNVFTFDVTDRSQMKLITRLRVGHPGLLGGSNIGSTTVRDLCGNYGLCCVQSNGQKYNIWNLTYQTGTSGSRTELPMNQPPELAWFLETPQQPSPTPIILPKGSSFVLRYNPLESIVKWALPVTSATTIAPVSGNREVISYVDGDGNLRVHNVQSGELIYTYNLQHAGQARPIFLEKEMVVVSGRNSYATNVPKGKYSPTDTLYIFTFK
jgi:hypothetical protein